MWPPSAQRTEAIRNAASGPINWPRVLRVAKRHQLIELLHEGLTRAQLVEPLEIARAISVQAEMSVRKNLEMARESLRIQRLFNDADLPVLFVKGAALAVLAFGNLGLRAGQDIDLLVSYEMLPAATALILRAGYRRFDPPADINDAQLGLLMPLRKDLGFTHEDAGLRVELHWRLFLNPNALSEASIVAASRMVPLTGTEGLRTLGEEDLFAYLCMHGAVHSWNRLKWLADVNALLARMPASTVEHLLRGAEARGAGRPATQALLLCRRLFGTSLPDRLTVTLDESFAVRWLEATALNALNTGQGEREPRQERFGTTRGSLSTFLLRRTWRYRLSELAFHLTNQTDVLAVPLPERLRFLYPILRLPLWLWRHARPRTVK
jgi:hypothetical protein